MTCDEARPRLSALLDNELPSSERKAAEAHLASCADCASGLEALRGASRLVRALPLKPLPSGFLARLEARRAGASATRETASGLAAWLAPRPLAFAGALAVVALVLGGPWRSARRAPAPGAPLESSADLLGAAAPAPNQATQVDADKQAASPPPAPKPDAAPESELKRKAESATFDEAGGMGFMGGGGGAGLSGSAGLSGGGAFSPGLAAGSVAAARGAANLDMPMHTRAAKKAPAGVAPGAPAGSPQPYSNEELHELLQKESDAAGMKGAAREEPKDPADSSFMGERLGLPSTRAQAEESIRKLRDLREQVEENAGKQRPVPIEGRVAPVLKAGRDASGGQAIDDMSPLVEGYWSGDYAAGNEGARAVENEAAWDALWRTLATTPAPPVDFKRSMVLAIFLGPRSTGGYSIEILDSKRLAHGFVVRWRERVPEPGMSPSEGATSPYALKVAPRSDVPVRFEKAR